MALDVVHAIEGELRDLVAAHGEVDGHDLAVDGGDATIYIYGQSADELWQRSESLLRGCAVAKSVTLRFGPAATGTPETEIDL